MTREQQGEMPSRSMNEPGEMDDRETTPEMEPEMIAYLEQRRAEMAGTAPAAAYGEMAAEPVPQQGEMPARGMNEPDEMPVKKTRRRRGEMPVRGMND